jgi:hypothetical protein
MSFFLGHNDKRRGKPFHHRFNVGRIKKLLNSHAIEFRQEIKLRQRRGEISSMTIEEGVERFYMSLK